METKSARKSSGVKTVRTGRVPDRAGGREGVATIHVPSGVMDALSRERVQPLFGWLHENGASLAFGPDFDGGTLIGYSVPGALDLEGEQRSRWPGRAVLIDPTVPGAAFAAQGWGPPERADLVPYEVDECFARNLGLVAGDAISTRRVALIGGGSVGSEVACDLVRQGVRRIVLIDPDTVDPVNMSRSSLDRSDIGAFKVHALRRRLLRYNPEASVEALPHPVEAEEVAFEGLVARTDLVVCAADSQVTRRYVNGVCVALRTPLLLLGFHDRAEACDIIWVTTPETPCLACINPSEHDDAAARSDIPYSTSEDSAAANGLVSDINLGNALGSSLALALIDPTGAGRSETLDPTRNRILIHSGRVPRGMWAEVFDSPFETVAFKHERIEECPHCGRTDEARAYRARLTARAGGTTADGACEERS